MKPEDRNADGLLRAPKTGERLRNISAKWTIVAIVNGSRIEYQDKRGDLCHWGSIVGGYVPGSQQWEFVYPEEPAESAASTAATLAVNDHTCPTCRNDRCSKTEKICWKCGSAL